MRRLATASRWAPVFVRAALGVMLLMPAACGGAMGPCGPPTKEQTQETLRTYGEIMAEELRRGATFEEMFAGAGKAMGFANDGSKPYSAYPAGDRFVLLTSRGEDGSLGTRDDILVLIEIGAAGTE